MATSIADRIHFKPTLGDNIALDIQKRIESGDYPLGSRLPGRRTLALEYSTAPLVIQQAINNLTASGLIASENGRGTFVIRTSPIAPRRLGTIGLIACVYDSWKGSGVRVEWAYQIMQTIERAITTYGGMSVFCNRHVEGGPDRPLTDAVDDVLSHGAEGIIFVLEQDERQFEELMTVPPPALPMVSIVWDACDLPVPIIYYDNVDAGQSAATHLIEQGCRKLLYFSTADSSWSRRRIQGAQAAVDSMRGSCTLDVRIFRNSVIPNALVDVDYEGDAAVSSRELLDSNPVFDGIIAANDRVANVFAAEALKRGLVVGKDYALIGFDNDNEARVNGLTTMQPPCQKMGQEAVHMLERATLDHIDVSNVRLRSHLVCRRSSCVVQR